MNNAKRNVAQLVKALFRDNMALYPANYTDPIQAAKSAKEAAYGYWENRTEQEEDRDTDAGITIEDYVIWTTMQLLETQKNVL